MILEGSLSVKAALQNGRRSVHRLLIDEKKKVVIITDMSPDITDCSIYVSDSLMENQIRLIVDSKYVLTGDFGESKEDTCLYSGQKNFVSLFKEAMRNEIELINLRSGDNEN